jgi:hypothetical protein
MLLREQQHGSDLKFGQSLEHQMISTNLSCTFCGVDIDLYGWVSARIEDLVNARPHSTQIHSKIHRFCYLASVDFCDRHDGTMKETVYGSLLRIGSHDDLIIPELQNL